MSKKQDLSRFTIDELVVIRETIQRAETKQALYEIIDTLIKDKKEQQNTSLNDRFPVDWFNIDKTYIELLHNNGIHNLAQLRILEEEALASLKGITKNGLEQISWARDFFDMTPIEQVKPEKRNKTTLAKVIVKHANECRKKHSNV